MRNLIMPVLWMNETVRFDVMTRQQLLDGFVTLKHKVFIIGMLLLTIGLLLWVIFILVSLIRTYIAVCTFHCTTVF
ncbi:unnamed protein product [Anisakis simplex]|uniref:Inner membrane protein n=1 Tax=Anisakis simplex TaxID=6269 RepID=A0A0M3JFR8_ANISI|nr:unnamed protein product [Anisakis simplex]